MSEHKLTEYRVWDLPVRLFHWINFTSVILLIFFGLMMLYKKDLGITSLEAKIALKEIHILIGYVFVLNLAMRIIWGFTGNRFARWRNIFPGRGFRATLDNYLQSLKAGRPQAYLGHNPLGRLAVSLIITLLLVLAITGLVRAGTDVYFPPFGNAVLEYIAAPGTDISQIQPYQAAGTVSEKVDNLKAFKKPFGSVHLYSAWALMLLIVIHISAVVRMEIKEGGSLISAMFSGKKILSEKPVDIDGDSQRTSD